MPTLEIQRPHGGLAIITNPAKTGAMCRCHASLRGIDYVGSGTFAPTAVSCRDSYRGSSANCCAAAIMAMSLKFFIPDFIQQALNKIVLRS